MHTLVVINGFKRSGKDTVVDHVAACANADSNGVTVDAISSIDAVFDMLVGAGIRMQRNALTPTDRTALAEVGNALEKAYRFKTFKCADFLVNNLRRAEDSGSGLSTIVFVHMREPDQIIRLGARVEQQMTDLGFTDYQFVTLLVRRPGDDQDLPDNASDRGVLGMHYDKTLHNDGTLEELGTLCWQLFKDLATGTKRTVYTRNLNGV